MNIKHKFLVIILIFSVFVPTVQAVTVDDLWNEISELKKEVMDLKAKSQVVNSSPVYDSKLNSVIQNMSTTDYTSISNLQTLLKNQGCDPGPIDGKYGPKTKAAVEKCKSVKSAGDTAITAFSKNFDPNKTKNIIKDYLSNTLPGLKDLYQSALNNPTKFEDEVVSKLKNGAEYLKKASTDFELVEEVDSWKCTTAMCVNIYGGQHVEYILDKNGSIKEVLGIGKGSCGSTGGYWYGNGINAPEVFYYPYKHMGEGLYCYIPASNFMAAVQ